MWEDLINREKEIDMRVMHDVCAYVSMNVYVNGIRLGYIIPEPVLFLQHWSEKACAKNAPPPASPWRPA